MTPTVSDTTTQRRSWWSTQDRALPSARASTRADVGWSTIAGIPTKVTRTAAVTATATSIAKTEIAMSTETSLATTAATGIATKAIATTGTGIETTTAMTTGTTTETTTVAVHIPPLQTNGRAESAHPSCF